MQTKRTILLFACFLFPLVLKAQESLISKYCKLSCPEKFWVIKHPLIAKKALLITQKSLSFTKTIADEFPIDNDLTGGQNDAFRHAYWMALLSQKIAPGKARKLGQAHEKGNYIQYRKGENEDGAAPDKVSCEMDTWNNDVGICIGIQNKKLGEKELKEIVAREILRGEMKIIKKDSKGNYLTCEGELISPQLLNNWENPKCLVQSNYKAE